MNKPPKNKSISRLAIEARERALQETCNSAEQSDWSKAQKVVLLNLEASNASSIHNALMALRSIYPPLDDVGIASVKSSAGREAAWHRKNSFTDFEQP
jgi:hypothetical protein